MSEPEPPPRPSSDPGSSRYVVAHVGAFDLASYGDQLYPLVAAHELRRRLDDVTVLPFGPVGAVGEQLGEAACWALGPWSPDRAAEIAGRADLVLCGGGEIVQGDGTIYAPFYGIDRVDAGRLALDRWYLEVLGPVETDCPVVWHAPGVPEALDAATAERLRTALADRAVVAVRDEASRQTLADAGVERDVAVVPDSALLLDRVFPAESLVEVRSALVEAGSYPPQTIDPAGSTAGRSTGSARDGSQVLVVQGNNVLSRFAAPLAAALDRLPDHVQVVTVSVSPCHDDQVFADALRQHLNRPRWDVPVTSSVEGIAAAIAGADCYLGVSLHGAVTAVAYGVPTVTFDPYRQAKLAAFLDLVGTPERRATDAEGAVSLADGILAARDFGLEPPVTPGQGGTLAGDTRTLPRLAGLRERIDAHFDQLAELLQQETTRREAGDRPAREPVDERDLGLRHLLSLRALPVPVGPLPETDVPGLRRPDPEIGSDAPGLQDALRTAAEARLARRAEDRAAVRALAELRSENADLRGAITHLEGVTSSLRQQIDYPGRTELLRRLVSWPRRGADEESP